MLRKFLLVLATCVPMLAAAQETPDALVKRVTDEVLVIIKSDKELQSGNQRKVVELAEQKVLPHFDFERMTRLAVGRGWAQATDAQKAALVKEFRTMLVRTYSSSLTAYRNQTIEVKPMKAAATDTDVTVRTAVIQPGGQPIPIEYAMEKGASGWKVYDVTIAGASLVTTYRGSFADEIQKGGVDGLVKTLATRNAGPAPAAPAKK
jgi:phospholipid transport system substrate-binding protein